MVKRVVMDKVGVMLSLIIYFSSVFAVSLSQKVIDNDAVSSIILELKNMKSVQSELNERLSEMDALRVRVTSLETRVEGLEKENQELKDKIKHPEKTAEHVNEDYNLAQVDSDNARHISEQKIVGLSMSHNTESKISQFQQRIQKRQVPADARVAFTAGVSATDLNLGVHHTILFDTAITNIGNAYHTTTGIFLAPYKGAYVFTLSMMVQPGHSLYLEIVIDGKGVNNIYANAVSEGDHMTTTKQWILEINKGSEVWIRTQNAGQLHGYMHSLISGFLLFETE